MKYGSSRVFAVCSFALTIAACSSGPPVQKVEVEKPQFKVLEAAPGGRETWLDTPQQWAEAKDLDVKAYYFYVGEARSADKRMACEKARADVADDVAKQVVAFVDSSIARASSDTTMSSSSGVSAESSVSEETQKMSSQLSKAAVNGVRVEKQYWERRDYSEAGGARSVYFCWVLAAVQKTDVKAMVARANSLRLQEPGLKEKVGDKLKNISEQYDAYQKEHL